MRTASLRALPRLRRPCCTGVVKVMSLHRDYVHPLRGLSVAIRTQSTSFGNSCRDPHGQRDTSLSRRPGWQGGRFSRSEDWLPPTASSAGVEPASHGSVDRCLVHWATRRNEVEIAIVTSDCWPYYALDESPQRPGYQPSVDRMRNVTVSTSCSRRDSNARHAV
jgi:hypothetical protein